MIRQFIIFWRTGIDLKLAERRDNTALAGAFAVPRYPSPRMALQQPRNVQPRATRRF